MMETYKVVFDPENNTGVYGISLVHDPAIDEQFIALSKQEQEVKLATVSDEKRIVMGAVLIPDKPIYRKDGEREFYIVFPQETIELAAQSFLINGFQSNSTLEHNPQDAIDGVTVVESWIKMDANNDKSNAYGFDYPVGTWVAMMKVNNDTIWNDYIKTGKVQGFSIDGMFPLEKVNQNQLNMNLNSIVEAIKDGFASIKLSEQQAAAATPETTVTLGALKTADGAMTIQYEGDALAVDTPVMLLDANGAASALPDGEYSLENGQTITVLGGKVAEIANAQEEAQDAEANTAIETETMMKAFAVEMTKAFASELSKVSEQVKTELSAIRKEMEAHKAETAVSLTKNNPEKSAADLLPHERHMQNRVIVG